MNHPPFDFMEQFTQIHLLMVRYTHQAHRNFNPFASSYSGQGRVLKLLQLKPKTTQKELAEILDMRSQSLGELLTKLEKKGYITRTQSATDKRVMEVTLTEQGMAANTAEAAANTDDEIFSCLSADEQLQLHNYLSRIITQLEASCTPEPFSDTIHRAAHEQMHEMFHSAETRKGRGNRRNRFFQGLSGDFFENIKETAEDCAAHQYDPEKIHCNGCGKGCPLSQPHCGNGAKLRQQLQALS